METTPTWKCYRSYIFCSPISSDDIRYQLTNDTSLPVTDTIIYNHSLLHLEFILNRHEKYLRDFPNMLLPTNFLNQDQINHLIREKQSYNIIELTEIVQNGVL
ncbi:3640_t:CDS:2 [Cetraspora pellucida]|uniref:3640_t:CDS:1 n=1 Tax=Cetraspora pellucida TaxID=1433469 RepID=A0A9N9CIT6_9GLOM|nr:3640_t:CDS:2 [Cetraspora pellucida]